MGTRNITMVISDGQTKVAQYGQWDGYPEGQGATILEFLSNTNLSDFKNKLKNVRFQNENDIQEKKNFLKSIGSEDGWVTSEQSNLLHEKYPFDNRDIAGKIFSMVMESELDEIVLVDSSDFVNDSLFCEWAYVVDLDKNVLEVYEGFQQSPLTESDRFYSDGNKKEEYYPVKMIKSYSLSELPTEEQFIKDFVKEEEKENN